MQNHNFYVLTRGSLTQGCCFNNHSSDSNSFNLFNMSVHLFSNCPQSFSPFTGQSACDRCPFGVQTHVHKWDMWAKHIFISGSLRNVHATFSSDFGLLRETFSCSTISWKIQKGSLLFLFKLITTSGPFLITQQPFVLRKTLKNIKAAWNSIINNKIINIKLN